MISDTVFQCFKNAIKIEIEIETASFLCFNIIILIKPKLNTGFIVIRTIQGALKVT